MPNRTDSPSTAPAGRSPNPSGRRRRDPRHFASETAASEFPGLPEGVSHEEIGDLLDTLGNRSGWSAALIKHFKLLLEWTRPQDWLPGKQPIVWLSVSETAWKLGISKSQVRRNEARMHGFGALAWNDSPNHRRFGCRDATGEIVEA